ncbi:hypothetical protein GW916_04905 [bacterium]|nr:hypothetical protein [bacterium]
MFFNQKVLNEDVQMCSLSKGSGPHLLIFGAIHGNETCGPEALERIRFDIDSGKISLKQGTVTWVPVCNPEAFKNGARYVEENLNRVFEVSSNVKSYEERLAQVLCPLFAGADFFLDLHSMQSEGDPFVFLNESTEASRVFCESLGLPYLLEGWPAAYRKMPQFRSACTQTFADKLNIPNALVECGRHGTAESAQVGYESVKAALKYLDMIPPESSSGSTKKPIAIEMKDIILRENAGDSLARDWRNFDPIKKGDLLATRSSGVEILAPYSGYMILPSPDSNVGTELFYLGT